MSDVTVRGPIFDGQAAAAAHDALDEARKDVASRGVTMLRAVPMDKTGRARGNFQANLHVVQAAGDSLIPAPTIKGVTWGPWLEGTTRRNDSTRFKGYHLFRQTARRLRALSGQMTEEVLQRYLPRMGGR